MKTPEPAEIRQKREQAGLTQEQAAHLVHYSFDVAWNRVERGERKMPLDKWELFLIKTNQHPDFRRKK